MIARFLLQISLVIRLKVITVELDRYLPTAKTINYLPAVIALKKAKRAGGVEALYVNDQGHILEATTSNFLIFHGSQLIVPKDEILFGIQRSFFSHSGVREQPIEPPTIHPAGSQGAVQRW